MTVEEILRRKIEEMEKTISGLTKQNEEYRILIKNNGLKGAKKDYKDRLFKFIFGNPENKQWTLSLYNAINGTDYTNPDDIQFNTIGDAVYMRMKNDISFIVAFEMDLWEHQSSFNPKEGLIPRSLLRNKLMTNEVSLGLIPRSLLRGVSFPTCP